MIKVKNILAPVLLSAALATTAHALTLTFDEYSSSSNTPATGASGVADLVFTDLAAGTVRITATVSNTTDTTTFGAGATEAQLTGFGFDLLGGVSWIGTGVAGSFLDTTLTNAAFSPFGVLDLAFADNTNFLGGNANSALPEGQTDTIVFDLTVGSYGNAAGLESAFTSALYSGDIDAGLRFMQVNAGAGSDKLLWGAAPTTLTPMPIPASGVLMIAGLGALAAIRRRRKAA